MWLVRGRVEIIHLILKTRPTLLFQKFHCVMFRLKPFSFLPLPAPVVCSLGCLEVPQGSLWGKLGHRCWWASGMASGAKPVSFVLGLLCKMFEEKVLKLKLVWEPLVTGSSSSCGCCSFPLPSFPPSLPHSSSLI